MEPNISKQFSPPESPIAQQQAPSSPSEGSIHVTLTYDREGGVTLSPPRRMDLQVTPALAGVFARAAQVNRSDETPVSFTSLLVGLMTGVDPVSASVREELGRQGVPARRIADRRSRGFDEEGLHAMDASAMPVELAMSVSARRAIEEGRAIAGALDSGPALDIRHVAAAYPVLPDWHEHDFEALGIDRLAWCRAFGASMARLFSGEKWYWRRYADRASPVPLTSFSADVYTETDLLGIDRSVDALALLIASTKTDTPLAIGVFGEWGSGKSFFMRHLRKRIWSLAERERRRVSTWVERRAAGTATAGDAPLYYGQVAQVEFNAWHYNEGNLVASLVDHLFRNLRVLPDDPEVEKRRKDVLLQLSGAEDDLAKASTALDRTRGDVEDAQGEVARATAAVATVRQAIDDQTRQLEASNAEADRVRSDLDAAVQQLAIEASVDPRAVVAVALQPLIASEGVAEATRVGRRFAEEAGSGRQLLGRLLSARGAAVVALCLAAPFVAWVTDWVNEVWAALAGIGTTAAAGLAHVTTFIRERRREFDRQLEALDVEERRRLEERRQALEQRQAELRVDWEAKVGALRATLDRQHQAVADREAAVSAAARALTARTQELDARVEERAAAQARLDAVRAQLARLSSALLLDEFIKDRSGTDEYRRQLGLLALVRRDFERLSDLITAANADWCAPDRQGSQPLLNRIVLYIDDLDRCRVETVLKVLEAVHLLLAFPLFVCVVAVDPRWVERCLRDSHQHLFGDAEDGSARVTVGDYLEKIFQIPIWMNPIADWQRAAVVKSLLGPTADPVRAGRMGDRPGGSLAAQTPLPGAEHAEERGGRDGFQDVVNRAAENPDPLRITSEEAQFVDEVAPMLSDKPRALKRFVNTYRLLKASLPDIDREGFVSEDPSSPYRICLTQLAFFTGHPRLAPLLVRQLARAPETEDVPLSDWLDTQPDEVRAPLMKAMALVPGRNGELRSWSGLRLRAFRDWLPDTTRYLFHRDR